MCTAMQQHNTSEPNTLLKKINGMLFSQSIASGQLNFLDIDLFS